MKALMIQGTGSNIGKSLLVAGLCRAARRRGIAVLPFKPQNMSNNAAVTIDGGEIGRAQALQALACGLEPRADMNPVLLKPEGEGGAQLIVQGQRRGAFRARDYAALKPGLIAPVLESFNRLKAEADLVLVEGAGSPAEVNLRAGDIANMGFARAAAVPVVLAGDIDRGGIIAQLVGTQAVLAPEDAAQIAGFVVNKFRGDPALFSAGYSLIEARTGWRGYGILPYFAAAALLPAEDAQDLSRHARPGAATGGPHIAALCFARIANFDDLDPIAQHPGLRFTLVRAGEAVPGDCALVILPGSKATRQDLALLRAQGWDIDLAAHIRRGGRVLGLCGGYQMLGRMIHDPEGIEGAPGSVPGLGLLDIETVMTPEKRLARVRGEHVASGLALSGYEIHIGRSAGPGLAHPFARLDGEDEGAISPDGRVMGTYLHGLFAEDAFRAHFLAEIGAPAAGGSYRTGIEAVLDALAEHMERHLDIAGLLALAR